MSVNSTRTTIHRALARALLTLGAVACCAACLSAESLAAPDSGSSPANDPRRRIAAEALALEGRTNLKLEGKQFPWDCSGTVLATLWNSGVDVTREYGSYDGNGVKRLWEIAKAHQLDYDLPLPEVGDIIFWDNTYDKNGDLLWNDELTHTGVVVGVTVDGTVSYLHHDYRRGIVVAKMNLLYPESRYGVLPDGTKIEINSPLRMNSERYLNPSRWLSSHLFRGFAHIHRLIDVAR